MSYQGGPGFGQQEAESVEEQLHRAQASMSMRQSELVELERIRTTTPMSRQELDTKDQEIQELRDLLANTEIEIQGLKKKIAQQQDTIYTQSKTIQDPFNSRQSHFHTPHKLSGNNRFFGSGPARQGGPQNFNNNTGVNAARLDQELPSVYDNISHPNQYTYGPAPATRQNFGTPSHHQNSSTPSHTQIFGSAQRQSSYQPRATNVTEWGSPQAIHQPQAMHQHQPNFTPHHTQKSSGSNYFPTPRTRHSSGNSIPFIGPRQKVGSTTSTALVKHSDNFPGNEVNELFRRVFEMAEQYAFAHVNHPSANGDAALPHAIKDRVFKAAAPLKAFPLMNSPQTRYFLATKIIAQWVIKHVFKVNTFEGFAPDLDQEINSNRGAIYQSTPAQLRHLYLNTIALALNKMKSRPGFYEYITQLSRDRGNALWAIIKPLMHVKTTQDWTDLFSLMEKAHELAEKMYTGSEEYRFDTPSSGKLFDCQTMISKSTMLAHLSGGDLEAQGATVTLGVTPHVTVRTSTPAGLVSTVTILPAMVMVKLPNSQMH